MRLAAFLTVAVLCGCAAGSVRSDSCPSLRMMTWNIAAGHGDLSRVANQIRSINPDVAALQEVDVKWSERSAFVDQADSLSKLLHMNVRFGRIYDIASRQFGVVVMSRYPIISSTNHEITRLSTQQQNAVPAKAPGFLETVLDVAGTRVRVFSTHLDYRADPSVRTTQVREMMEIASTSKMPTVLAGDLNATPGAPELAPLMTAFKTLETPMTYPAGVPAKRIDFILTDGLSITQARVDSTDASDHRPVIMTVSPCSK